MVRDTVKEFYQEKLDIFKFVSKIKLSCTYLAYLTHSYANIKNHKFDMTNRN